MTRTRLATLSAVPLCLLLLFSNALVAQSNERSSSDREIQTFLPRFISAFNNLDWEEFRNSFSDDATVFFPRGTPNRATGRAEFEEHFKQVFAQIRGGKTVGPYMDIRPRALNIQTSGNISIVTFHLDDRPGFINRRTLILRKGTAGWKILHLHASEVAVDPPSPKP